jgi:hypothetical protein
MSGAALNLQSLAFLLLSLKVLRLAFGAVPCRMPRAEFARMMSGLQAHQLLGERSYPIGVTAAPTNVHPRVAAIGQTRVRKRLSERREASLLHGIVFVTPNEHADAPVALLRPRPKGPRHRAAEERVNSRRLVIRSPR